MGGAPLCYAGDQAYAVNGLALDLVGAGGGPLPPASMDLIGLDVTSDEALALVEDGLNEFLDEVGRLFFFGFNFRLFLVFSLLDGCCFTIVLGWSAMVHRA